MKKAKTVDIIFALTLASVVGCVTAEKKAEKVEAGEKIPFVEAYIEFLGPNEKWAGPSTYLLHVNANESRDDLVQIEISPELLEFEKPSVIEPTQRKKEKNPAILNRVLASKTSEKINQKIAQKRLNELALAMQEEDVSFEACLSPLKVRMTRVDGKVFEKEGCRGVDGWPKKASELSSQLIQEKLKN